jgi:transposase
VVLEGNGCAARMLGLDDFEVVASEEINGELQVRVQTPDGQVMGCHDCGVRAQSKGRRTVRVRDLPASGRPVVLVWHKRLWRCTEPACPVKTWTEASVHIAARAVLTVRARAEMCRRVGEDADSVAQVARAFGVSWHTAMAAVRDEGQPKVDDPSRLDGVTALGMDETAWLKATRTHATLYVSGLVDTGTGRLLDVVADRTAHAVTSWLSRRDRRWLARISVVTLDPHHGYAHAVGVHLGHATLVVDHFHAVALGNRAVDDVRRRVQQATLGHRGRKADPLYRIRRLLLAACDDLDTRGWWRLAEGLRLGDPDHELLATWQLKEALRDVYRARDIDAAREALKVFYQWATDSGVDECRRLARTIRRWKHEVLAWHVTDGASNGPTEAVNLAIKHIKRVGRGFRNFDNYRLRLLLHCGVDWHTPATARLRTRAPRSVS